MKQAIVWRLTIDSEDLPEGVVAWQHFKRLQTDLQDSEPETDIEILAGVLDTMKQQYVEERTT